MTGLTDNDHTQHGVRDATSHRQDHCPLLLCGIHTGGVPSFGLLVHAGRTILGSSSEELYAPPSTPLVQPLLTVFVSLAECATYYKHMIFATAFNISSDLMLLAIPIPIVVRSQLPMKR